MPKPVKSPPASPWDSEVLLLLWLATCVSILAFLFYFKRGEVLLYGDAIAHLNIARRVFDSKTPGLLQLGTVWLPLPHLLMIPFLLSDQMWQRGVGGSIPSLIAYVLGVVGMFRLVRGTLSHGLEPDGPARIAAWTATLIFAANPNLIYMQTTAMGEALYLALFLWAVAYFSEFVRGDARALVKCGVCLVGACLTRYDGWFLAAAMAGVVVIVNFLPVNLVGAPLAGLRVPRPTLAKFALLAAIGPALWLAYNGIVYRNPLEFENGPYSAKAIERKTQGIGDAGHPGGGNLVVASLYFLKSGEVNIAENQWLQRTWVLLAVAAIAGAALTHHSRTRTGGSTTIGWLPLFFLLTPVPFYALSVAYGGVPIFVPAWWPFSHYNVRYGLQLLPAFAVGLAIFIYCAIQFAGWSRRLRAAVVALLFAVVTASYASVWYAGPQSLQEPQVNNRGRNQLEAELAIWLRKLPPDATLLMYVGDHVGALQSAGVPLKRVINEGNHRAWKQPSDSEGLWERALADPAQYADYAIASEGDVVWQAARARRLPVVVVFHTTGQAAVALYRAR
jgi:hypothetical protein